MFAIEKRFGIKLTGAEIADAASAGELIRLVVAKTADSSAAEVKSA